LKWLFIYVICHNKINFSKWKIKNFCFQHFNYLYWDIGKFTSTFSDQKLLWCDKKFAKKQLQNLSLYFTFKILELLLVKMCHLLGLSKLVQKLNPGPGANATKLFLSYMTIDKWRCIDPNELVHFRWSIVWAPTQPFFTY